MQCMLKEVKVKFQISDPMYKVTILKPLQSCYIIILSLFSAKYAEVAVVATENPSTISVVTVSAMKQGPAGTIMKKVSRTRQIYEADVSQIPIRQISQEEIISRQALRSAQSATKREQVRQDRQSNIDERQKVERSSSQLGMENEENIRERIAIEKVKRDLSDLKSESGISPKPTSSRLSYRSQSPGNFKHIFYFKIRAMP